MRAWEQHLAELKATGAQLLILSGDDRDVLTTKVAERGFGELLIAPASPEDWAALGVTNPKRPDLPHPTTMVLGPDGSELLREVHENFRQRSDPERALAALAGGEVTEATAVATPLDWEAAATRTVVREGTTLKLVLEVAEGFHAYGSREEVGVPVYLRIDGGPKAEAPAGEAKAWSLGTSWVLEGQVELTVEVGATGTVSGQAGWQLCTDSSCSAPRNAPFTLAPGESKPLE